MSGIKFYGLMVFLIFLGMLLGMWLSLAWLLLLMFTCFGTLFIIYSYVKYMYGGTGVAVAVSLAFLASCFVVVSIPMWIMYIFRLFFKTA